MTSIGPLGSVGSTSAVSSLIVGDETGRVVFVVNIMVFMEIFRGCEVNDRSLLKGLRRII